MKTRLLLVVLAALAIASYITLRVPNAEHEQGIAPREGPHSGPTDERSATVELPEESPRISETGRRQVTPGSLVGDLQVGASSGAQFPPATSVRGILLDLEGMGLAGVEVCQSIPEGPCATSAADGTFTVQVVRAGEFRVRSESFVTVAAGRYPSAGHAALTSADEPEVTVIASPRVVVGGIIVGEDGVVIAGAHLSLKLPDSAFYSLGEIAAQAQRLLIETTSTTDGEFRFENAPSGVAMWAEASGYAPRFISLPSDGDPSLVIVLGRLQSGPDTLTGQVVDALGSPVEGARVSAGGSTVMTGADGLFRLSRTPPSGLPKIGDMESVVAIKSGFLPAQAPLPVEGSDEFILLVLDGIPLSIAGRVVNESGEPIAGISVHPWNRVGFGAIPTEAGFSRPVDIEELLAGPEALESRTDAAGAFVVRGLLDREYQLEAVDEAHLVVVRTPLIRAGARGVVISFSPPPDKPWTGRVLQLDGQPAAGVQVMAALRAAYEGEGDQSFGIVAGPVQVTGPDGVFQFEGIAREGIVFNLLGESIVPQFMVAIPVAPLPVELVVARRCELRIQRMQAGNTIAAKTLDGDGHPLSVTFFEGDGVLQRFSFSIPADGAAQVVHVSEQAVVLALYDGGLEVQRKPLDLTPGEVNEVSID